MKEHAAFFLFLIMVRVVIVGGVQGGVVLHFTLSCSHPAKTFLLCLAAAIRPRHEFASDYVNNARSAQRVRVVLLLLERTIHECLR